MTKHYVTVEDESKAYTTSFNTGCVGHRLVRIGVLAGSLNAAQAEAIEIVASLHRVSTECLTIVA